MQAPRFQPQRPTQALLRGRRGVSVPPHPPPCGGLGGAVQLPASTNKVALGALQRGHRQIDNEGLRVSFQCPRKRWRLAGGLQLPLPAGVIASPLRVERMRRPEMQSGSPAACATHASLAEANVVSGTVG